MKKSPFILLITALYFYTQANAQKIPRRGCTTQLAPVMFKQVDTALARGVADNYHMWENGSVITVKFMPGGSKSLRDKVMQYAREWEQFANIKLKLVPDFTSVTNIRIKLGNIFDSLGHNSVVGTECNFVNQWEQTMNLDTTDFFDYDYYISVLKKRNVTPYLETIFYEAEKSPARYNYKIMRGTVLHEFGHALGLLHEQSYPGGVKWNRDTVYKYYKKTQPGWNEATIDFNVLEVSNQFYTNGTKYDPKSIMHYSVPAWQTLDGKAIEENYILSAGDKQLISALYPKNKKLSSLLVPKVDVTNFTRLDVMYDSARNGLLILPSFDIKTNQKMGRVYFVAKLVYEDGSYVSTKRLFYNWGGCVATYLQMNLLPNSRVSYNKLVRNLELVLPYSQIPDLKGRRVIIVFSVELDDIANGQLNKLMYYNYTTPLSIRK